MEIGFTTRTTKYKAPILTESWKINSTEWLSNGHIDKYFQLMMKNQNASKLGGLFNPELFFNYKFYTTCFNPDTIFDSPFAQIILVNNHWVTISNFNPFYTQSTDQKW